MDQMQTIPLGRAGKYGSLTVDTAKFTDAIRDHVWAYGLRQILNDAIADKTDDDDKPLAAEELIAKAQKRLDTLYSGEVRTRTAAEPADPVLAELVRIVRGQLQPLAKATPEFKSAPKAEKDKALWTINERARARGDRLFANWTELAEAKATDAQKREAARRVRDADKAAGEIEI